MKHPLHGLFDSFPIGGSVMRHDEELRALAFHGLRNRLIQRLTTYPELSDTPYTAYYDRLEKELSAINTHDLESEFIMAADCVMWAKDKGIYCSPGRGMSSGSLVSYALGITDSDPLRYDLLFEYVINKNSCNNLQFMFNFSEERYEEVREYAVSMHGVNSKTGKQRHFLDYSPDTYHESSRYESDLRKTGHRDDHFHSISGDRALSLIAHVQQIVQQDDPRFNINRVRDDDGVALEVAVSGEMDWILLLWGHDMLDVDDLGELLSRFQPPDVNRLALALSVATNPDEKFVSAFMNQKSHGVSRQYPCAAVSKILDESYGVIVYQEQLMRIICEITGYTMDQANRLRKIFGRKAATDIDLEEPLFTVAAVGRGVDVTAAHQIYNSLIDAVCSTKSKSQALATALIVYRCAYLRAHFPEQYAAGFNKISHR